MADVARIAGAGEQIRLVAGLRWRVLRNSLRTKSAQLDLLAVILVGLLGSLFVLGTGFGLGAASYFLVAQGRFGMLALPFWAAFLMWQVMPLVLTTAGREFDLRSLLRFPLRFSVFFLLHAAYGLADPPAVAALVWLAGIASGISLARSDLLSWAVLLTVVFAAVNLLLSRVILTWLGRLLARRRSREVLTAALLLLVVCTQLFAAIGSRWEKPLRPYLEAARPTLELLPPGQAAKALGSAAASSPQRLAAAMALLAAYGLGCGLLLRLRLRAQYLGEELSESQAPAAAAAVRPSPVTVAGAAAGGSQGIPLLSGPVAAAFRKELRYLLRNSTMFFLLVLPLVLIAVFSLGLSTPRRAPPLPGSFTRAPELAFPAAVAYMFLIVSQLAYNSFAYDSRGVQVFFVAPVRFRDVLLAKNLLLGVIVGVESVLVWAVVSATFVPPGTWIMLATYAALLFATLVEAIIGNWLSLQFPRRFEFGQARQRKSGVAVLVTLLLQVALLGMVWATYLLLRLLGQVSLLPVVFAVLSAIALAGYVASLDRFEHFATCQREVLIEQLCR